MLYQMCLFSKIRLKFTVRLRYEGVERFIFNFDIFLNKIEKLINVMGHGSMTVFLFKLDEMNLLSQY